MISPPSASASARSSRPLWRQGDDHPGDDDRFADLSHDRQWIHVDVERARRESPFRTTIAHGFFVLSLIPCCASAATQIVGYGNDKLRLRQAALHKPGAHRQHPRTPAAAWSPPRKPKGTLCTEEIEILRRRRGAAGAQLSHAHDVPAGAGASAAAA